MNAESKQKTKTEFLNFFLFLCSKATLGSDPYHFLVVDQDSHKLFKNDLLQPQDARSQVCVISRE